MTAAPRETEIVRVFDAPPELVWNAWTEQEQPARWWRQARLDNSRLLGHDGRRSGGAFRLTSISDEDGVGMRPEATYREIDPAERVVVESGDGRLATVRLGERADGGTEMTFRTTIEASEALLCGTAAGLHSAFDRLAEQLQTTATRSRA